MTGQQALRPDSRSLSEGGGVPETAMVLAAGLGTRMRPLTENCPKPLVPVAGKPMIDHVFDRLRAAGVRRAVVNGHYLFDQLQSHLAGISGIEVTVSDERAQLMETGGGLVQARALLGEAPFLVTSSDVLWVDGPADSIKLLASHWDDERMDVLMLLVPLARAHCHRGQGDFDLDTNGRITGRRKPGQVAPFVYTSVQIMSPRLLADPPAGPFSQMLFWERAIASGRAFGIVHQGRWFDIGRPAAIAETEQILADG